MANRLMRWFDCRHLPQDLRAISRNFEVLAEDINHKFPESAEKTAGLRKLLEAKDCIVRCGVELRESKENE